MRPLFVLLAALLLSAPWGARAQVLPLGPDGRAELLEVVRADSLTAGQLFARAEGWLRRRGYALALADSAAGRLEATHAFGLYDRGYVSKRLHGQVRYGLTVEVKPGRYRLRLHNFVFAYYQEDRTGRFVPTGKTRPLENPAAPGWQKLWESHRHDTLLTATRLAAELKAAMRAVPKAPVVAQRPLPTDW